VCAGNCGRDDCDTSCVGGMGVGGGKEDGVGRCDMVGNQKGNMLFHNSLLFPCVLFPLTFSSQTRHVEFVVLRTQIRRQVHNAYLDSDP
jgi:hypothetical protein